MSSNSSLRAKPLTRLWSSQIKGDSCIELDDPETNPS